MPPPELSVIIPTHDNLPLLRRCLEGWRRYAADQPVEVIVVEDGCTDGTTAYLAELSATDWGRRVLRTVHEDDAHELVCTNRGLAEARAPLAMSWQDDMFLRAEWMVPELIATFRAIPGIGMLCLSRGLTLSPAPAPPETFAESVDWRRVQSTIGPAPVNWLALVEVDAVIRPWVVRKACVEAVGALDPAFRPTEWDESDLAYRIRRAGWKVAAHGYERDGAYEHALSSTLNRTPSERRQAVALKNARLFWERWGSAVAEDHARPRERWRRRATAAGWAATLRQMLRFARPRREDA